MNYEYLLDHGTIVKVETYSMPSQFPDNFARSIGFDSMSDLKEDYLQFKKAMMTEDYNDYWKANARGGTHKPLGNVVRWFDARGSVVVDDKESYLRAMSIEANNCSYVIMGSNRRFPSCKHLEKSISLAQQQMKVALLERKSGRELIFACLLPVYCAQMWADEKALEYHYDNVEDMSKELESV